MTDMKFRWCSNWTVWLDVMLSEFAKFSYILLSCKPPKCLTHNICLFIHFQVKQWLVLMNTETLAVLETTAAFYFNIMYSIYYIFK